MSTETSFDTLGLASELASRLHEINFTTPTPIQAQAIPIAVTGADLIGIAQTGTGKTLAFGLPMLQRLAEMDADAQGLVLVPTRELAEQVRDGLRKVVPGLPLALVIGGASANRQIAQLKNNPKLIIATPGRLIDLMEAGQASLKNVHILALDEADRMLDMGFAPQINKIMERVPTERQTLLFSATMPASIEKLTAKFLQNPQRVEVARAGTTSDQVEQELYVIPREAKLGLLQHLLTQFDGTVLVFSRTKYGASKIARAIRNMDHGADEIHANRSLGQRRRALAGFKDGTHRVLVATDIAARGIDVTGIELVINFDLPDNPEDYVHRIGRTGRASHRGYAISFATPDQAKDVSGIERVIRNQLPIAQTPEGLPQVKMPAAPRSMERGGRGGGRAAPRGGRGGSGGGRRAPRRR